MAIIRLIFGLIFLLDTKVLCNRIPAQQENCASDEDCRQNFYCISGFCKGICVPCHSLNRQSSNSSRNCARTHDQCGNCIDGYQVTSVNLFQWDADFVCLPTFVKSMELISLYLSMAVLALCLTTIALTAFICAMHNFKGHKLKSKSDAKLKNHKKRKHPSKDPDNRGQKTLSQSETSPIQHFIEIEHKNSNMLNAIPVIEDLIDDGDTDSNVSTVTLPSAWQPFVDNDDLHEFPVYNYQQATFQSNDSSLTSAPIYLGNYEGVHIDLSQHNLRSAVSTRMLNQSGDDDNEQGHKSDSEVEEYAIVNVEIADQISPSNQETPLEDESESPLSSPVFCQFHP